MLMLTLSANTMAEIRHSLHLCNHRHEFTVSVPQFYAKISSCFWKMKTMSPGLESSIDQLISWLLNLFFQFDLHQTMLQGLPIYGDCHKAKALVLSKNRAVSPSLGRRQFLSF